MARKNYASDRLQRLKEHLQLENSDLTEAVDCYESLDQVGRKMGLLEENDSYANQISWWPLVSVLGTFSAGKSSFINSWIGQDVQRSGNQAVDDHFTILAYGKDDHVKTLPGQALDSDPRFPFYQISKDIEHVSPGDGTRIDKFLQMKVVPSEVLRGKLVIDSPGFDADEQRKSTLRITNHIIRLSDLVLVFFDARHPESGAMQDTLEHLVRAHLDSLDSEKFIYILNQIDTSARDNNLEEIVASWRSSLVQAGLSAGRFYVHYNEDIAIPVENKDVWNTYKQKRDADHKHIMDHLAELNTVRSYRIVGNIKLLSNTIEERAVPKLNAALKKWRSNVKIVDFVLLFLIAMAVLVFWTKLGFAVAPWQLVTLAIGSLVTLLAGHIMARKSLMPSAAKSLKEEEFGNLRAAFLKSASSFGSVWLRKNPVGWNARVKRRLDGLRNETEQLIERLNTKNSDPAGTQPAAVTARKDTASSAEKPDVSTVKKNTSGSSPAATATTQSVATSTSKKEQAVARPAEAKAAKQTSAPVASATPERAKDTPVTDKGGNSKPPLNPGSTGVSGEKQQD